MTDERLTLVLSAMQNLVGPRTWNGLAHSGAPIEELRFTSVSLSPNGDVMRLIFSDASRGTQRHFEYDFASEGVPSEEDVHLFCALVYTNIVERIEAAGSYLGDPPGPGRDW